MIAVGQRTWAIAEGYIPGSSVSDDPTLLSHETACILNTNDCPANVTLTLFFADRTPAGRYRITVAARRTLHLRFNELCDPEPGPRDTDYASLFESDVPVVIQHTRLDSRNPNIALLSTMAFSAAKS